MIVELPLGLYLRIPGDLLKSGRLGQDSPHDPPFALHSAAIAVYYCTILTWGSMKHQTFIKDSHMSGIA